MCEAMVLSWRMGPTPISPADIWQMSGDNFDSHNLGERVVILASSEQRPEMQLNILKFIGQPPNNKDLGSPKCQQGWGWGGIQAAKYFLQGTGYGRVYWRDKDWGEGGRAPRRRISMHTATEAGMQAIAYTGGRVMGIRLDSQVGADTGGSRLSGRSPCECDPGVLFWRFTGHSGARAGCRPLPAKTVQVFTVRLLSPSVLKVWGFSRHFTFSETESFQCMGCFNGM